MNKESLISKEEYTFYEDKRIWSKSKSIFLKGYVTKKGYVIVNLKCIDGKIRHFFWHRVIWFAFNGMIPEGMQVNHIREFEKTNNALSNLNLMTPKENTNWGTGHERAMAKQRGVPKPKVSELMKGNTNGKLLKNHPLRSKPVVAIDKDGNVVYDFPSTMEAWRNGFDSRAVSKCCNNCYGKLGNFYKGYYWFWKKKKN